MSGRKEKTVQQHAEEAAYVISVALAVAQKRVHWLAQRGLDLGKARRYALRRRRGLTGMMIGTSAHNLLAPKIQRAARAAQLMIEHEFPLGRAMEQCGLDDERGVWRALRKARREAADQSLRLQKMTVPGHVERNLSIDCQNAPVT
jgi:methylphosphotriester-DNA--protein-cysteine methyltransferase